jgi:hypothetical protein
MNLSARTATIALLLAASLSARAADPPALQPQHAVLVLRNDQVLEGEVTPAGDYYLLSLGKTGQVRLAAKDVEMVCRNLQEAYERKAAGINEKSAAAHVELAQWCLRQAMHEQARAELAAAKEIEPTYRRIAVLEQRLEFATTPKQPVAAHAPPPLATVGTQQLDRTMKELPPGTVEHFTAVIQPILLDRCGNAACHGARASARFQLLQPVAGKIPSRRFTQRNLFSTLSIVNKELADDSELLAMSLKPHGPVRWAAFKSEEDKQYREVAEWIASLQAVPKQSPPATVNTAQVGRPRHQVGGPPTDRESESHPEGKPQAPPESPAAEGRDPFDPEIFNRRFHPQRQP